MALNIGDRVGPFELLEEIGSGGMGVVFRARDMNSGNLVAVKTLASSSSVRAARLRHEADFLSALEHPGVMPLIARGETKTRNGDPLPWFAMALQEPMTLAVFRDRLFDWAHDGKTESGRWTPVPGKAIASRAANDTAVSLAATQLPSAARGRLPEVIEIMAQLCDALAHVHAHGIVHCDIAPANVFLRGLSPVLADFDIAQRVDARCSRLRGNCGTAGAGTSHYMSPEQFTGAPLDPRSDLYGLGCVFFELLTGRPPFTGSPATIREGHIYRPPRSPADLVRDVPSHIEALVMSLLAKEPHERPPFAEDVRAVLAREHTARAGRVPRSEAFNPSYIYSPRYAGRPELVGELVERLSDAQRGQGGLVLVRGPKGSGKSRLLCSACEGQTIMALELSPAAKDKSWVRSFGRLFDFAAKAILTEVDGPLARWISRCGPYLAPYSESISELIRGGLRPADDRVLVESVVELLQTLAGDRGLTLLADDLHHYPTNALRVLLEASSTGNLRTRPLVLAAAPQDWETVDARSDSARVIDLQPLEAADLQRICCDALGDEDLPTDLIAPLILASRGSPGRLLDAIERAINEDALYRDGPGSWSLRPQRVAAE